LDDAKFRRAIIDAEAVVTAAVTGDGPMATAGTLIQMTSHGGGYTASCGGDDIGQLQERPVRYRLVLGFRVAVRLSEFLRSLEFIPAKYRLMVLVAQCLGLRVSEIVGLKWEDFDFDAGTVLVQRSAVYGRVDSVKTEYSHDLMPLDSALAAPLLEWQKSALPEGRSEWAFQNPVTGRPYH
jgi:integrase